MNSEESTVGELSAIIIEETDNITTTTTTSGVTTNTVIMENNDNIEIGKIVNVANENISQNTTRSSNRSNDNDDYWAEIENEDLILNLSPSVVVVGGVVVEKTTEQILATAIETSPSISTSTQISTISTNATTAESVTSRLLRKRDELAKKYGIGEVKHEQTDNKVDLSETNDGAETSLRKEQTLDEFKEDLRLKRLARQTAVQDLRHEIHTLRSRLVEPETESEEIDSSLLLTQKMHNDIQLNKEEKLCLNNENAEVVVDADAVANVDADDENPMSRSRHANIELANAQLALQMANAENLTLNTELGTVHKQVITLKEVVACCKQMLAVKEEQCTQVCIFNPLKLLIIKLSLKHNCILHVNLLILCWRSQVLAPVTGYVLPRSFFCKKSEFSNFSTFEISDLSKVYDISTHVRNDNK